MAKPSFDEIRSRVANVVARPLNVLPIEIHDNDLLRDDLGYTDQGLAALTTDLNDEFFVGTTGLSTKQVTECLKVIGISAKVDQQPIANFK
jgi:ABC-type bacteriocin/lantibiotic exporter with double-glycine peptidase domain